MSRIRTILFDSLVPDLLYHEQNAYMSQVILHTYTDIKYEEECGSMSGNSSGTGEFPTQMTSYAGNVSIWWGHHDTKQIQPQETVLIISKGSHMDTYMDNAYIGEK